VTTDDDGESDLDGCFDASIVVVAEPSLE